MKDKWLIVGVSALIIGSGFWLGKYFYKAEESKAVAQQDSTSFVRDYSPRMGNENSKVTIVEFLDPECESCREVYPDVKAIVKEFDTQLVVRYAPFHPNSLFAIKILEGARKQNKYWETLDLLFEIQPEWGSHHNPQPEIIWNHLPKLGLDVEKIRAQMNDTATFDMVEIEKEDGAKLGVRGTPTFFVNGKIVQEFGMEYLRNAVKAEIEAAK